MNTIFNKGLRYGPYSHSKLDTHIQCPRRFKYKFVLRLPEGEADKTALFKGIRVHNLLEHYPNNQHVKTDAEQSKIVNEFITSALGVKYLEEHLETATREIQIKLALINNEIIPQDGFKRADIIFNGFVDYVNIIETNGIKTLNIIDWKTGKFKDQQHQDYSQLMYYQIYFFKKLDIDEIRISFCYVEHHLENDLVLKREYLKEYQKTLIKNIYEQEHSDYHPNKTNLCNWCPYQDVCSKDKS